MSYFTITEIWLHCLDGQSLVCTRQAGMISPIIWLVSCTHKCIQSILSYEEWCQWYIPTPCTELYYCIYRSVRRVAFCFWEFGLHWRISEDNHGVVVYLWGEKWWAFLITLWDEIWWPPLITSDHAPQGIKYYELNRMLGCWITKLDSW